MLAADKAIMDVLSKVTPFKVQPILDLKFAHSACPSQLLA